jgi:AcrR family transcriptional regulator
MPYPTQITLEQILNEAARLIEVDGVEHFSLARLAEELNVKPPSLYRYVEGKNDLLRQLNKSFLSGLVKTLQAAGGASEDHLDQFLKIMEAYRVYALSHPRIYLMSFSSMAAELRPDEEFLLHIALPLQSSIAHLAGTRESLAALRGAFALVHGYIMLELTDQLRRGGNLNADFRLAVRAYLAGWTTRNLWYSPA